MPYADYVSIAFVKLLLGCPYRKDAYDCPLRGVRKKPFIDRLRWTETLSRHEAKRVLAYHRQCSSRVRLDAWFGVAAF